MRTLLGSALLLALTALPMSAQAGWQRAPRAARLARMLHLTEAQKAGIQTVRAKHQPDLALRRSAFREARQALRAALQDQATPTAQLRSLYDKAASARFEMMLARRSMRQEVQALLTPEQRGRAAELAGMARARRRERMHHLRQADGIPR